MDPPETATLSLILDGDGRSGAERVALWRDAFLLAGSVDVVDAAAFAGRFVSRSLGPLRTMTVESTSFGLVRDRKMAAGIERDHVILNYVERGRISGRIGGRRIDAGPGTLTLSRLAVPIDLFMDDARWLALLIPRALFEAHVPWSPELDARMFDAGTIQAGVLGGLLQSLCGLADPLPAQEAERRVQTAFAVMAACLAPSGPGPRAAVRMRDDPTDAIRRFMGEHIADPELGPDLICREFGISRSRLYRIMGENADIVAIVRRMRLRGVQHDIVSGRFDGLPLTEIARRWGLGDERSFRRAFVREFGYPPSALRHPGERGKAAADLARDAVSTELERWLLGL